MFGFFFWERILFCKGRESRAELSARFSAHHGTQGKKGGGASFEQAHTKQSKGLESEGGCDGSGQQVPRRGGGPTCSRQAPRLDTRPENRTGCGAARGCGGEGDHSTHSTAHTTARHLRNNFVTQQCVRKGDRVAAARPTPEKTLHLRLRVHLGLGRGPGARTPRGPTTGRQVPPISSQRKEEVGGRRTLCAVLRCWPWGTARG